jgi:DNA mismatch repair protein MutS2
MQPRFGKVICMGEPFLDDESAAVLDWEGIWQAFQPVTPYGKAAKGCMRPFLPGQEAEWQASQVQLAADVNALDDGAVHQAVSILKTLPDIGDALDTLAHTRGALSAKQCLALKGFARAGRQLADTLHGVVAGGLSVSAWENLLHPFGQPDTASFSVTHIAGEAYVKAGQTYGEAVQRRSEASRHRNERVLQETGVVPNREGQLVLMLPQQRAMVEQLKSSPTVTWLRDTPFESVFEANDTEAMMAAEAAVETAETEIQAAAEEAMRHLADALRALLPAWLRAAEVVTDIDLRAAKVVLMRQWDGCVTDVSEEPQLTEGVQPLLHAVYAQAGRGYVPLDWHLAQGVNVLSGSNMGGKTLAMQLLCTCQCLAQYGLPVPAKKFSTRLYRAVRVCASTDTNARSGLSSFGVEMTRLVQTWPLLARTEPVLIAFDEPGRSTNPIEGEALVIGLLQATTEVVGQSVVLVATHFAGAIKVPGTRQYRVRGLGNAELTAMTGASQEDRMRALSEAMDYRVEPVAVGTFAVEGLRVAKWLGVPEAVVTKAEQFLEGQTTDGKGSRK